MAKPYDIPKNMHRYLKRLFVEYSGNDNNPLAQVIENSKYIVAEETGFDNWNGGMHGHDLTLYVPDELMGLIPLDDQQDIQNTMREDLNKAASGAQAEYINDVHFEYLDESNSEIVNAPSISSPQIAPEVRARIWKTDTIKLFISHRDTYKAEAYKLAECMTEYGVSSFVAHDSIEPDEEWQNEIEKALKSMDVLLAFITDDLFDSAWTNQEIGYALARGIPIISIKFSKQDPVGFISKRQAIKGNIDNMNVNAEKIWVTIAKRLMAKPIFKTAMINRFISSRNYASTNKRFVAVAEMNGLSENDIQNLVSAHNDNDQISGCFALSDGDNFLNFLNRNSKTSFVKKNNKIVKKPPKAHIDVPF